MLAQLVVQKHFPYIMSKILQVKSEFDITTGFPL